jgi:pimeloyl-ACP methyl ester carboxylesterase
MYLSVDNKKTYAYTANRAFDASKPTVAFIHGAAHDHSVWALQSRFFAYHGWNAFAIDLPGHGKSQASAFTNIEQAANWISRLLDEIGATQAALVGHSMGALIALDCASRYPGRISRIALVGCGVPMPVSAPLLNGSKANDHAAFDMINVYSHSPAAQIGGNRTPGMWMMGAGMRLLERSAPGVLHADFSACNSYVGGASAAKNSKCPVLMILGARDQMTPVTLAKALVSELSDVKVVTLEGTGHALMAEKPDEVLDNLIAFLR